VWTAKVGVRVGNPCRDRIRNLDGDIMCRQWVAEVKLKINEFLSIDLTFASASATHTAKV